MIEGEYFKIEQMLSSDYDTKVKINKRELLDCIDRATLLVKRGGQETNYHEYHRWKYGIKNQFLYWFHE